MKSARDYKDTGCKKGGDSCLECQLPQCVYDKPQKIPAIVQELVHEIVQQEEAKMSEVKQGPRLRGSACVKRGKELEKIRNRGHELWLQKVTLPAVLRSKLQKEFPGFNVAPSTVSTWCTRWAREYGQIPPEENS